MDRKTDRQRHTQNDSKEEGQKCGDPSTQEQTHVARSRLCTDVHTMHRDGGTVSNMHHRDTDRHRDNTDTETDRQTHTHTHTQREKERER